MRVVYMGTPQAVVLPLKAILEAKHDVVAVVSQPDRPKGRGRKTEPTEVKAAAMQLGLRVLQPLKASDPAFMEDFKALSPDVAVVMAFGQKIPAQMLTVPKYGFINIHASLLPSYRGAAPVQRAIMDGCRTTGVTIMYMSEGMDEGDIGLVREIPILPSDDYGTLLDKASCAGSELIVEMLRLLELGIAPRRKQDPAKATFAKKILKEDEEIDWGKGAAEIVDKVRALSPAPGARMSLAGSEMKVLSASVLSPSEADSEDLPEPERGLAVVSNDCTIFCSASDGWVKLGLVKPAGGNKMDCRAFSRGRRIMGRVSLKCGTDEVI